MQVCGAMAPKKKEPHRHDQTMVTILKLPLDAQRGNLQALLVRPTPLSDGELSQVSQNISLLLLRGSDAITQGEWEAFGFMVELLSRALTSNEALEHAVRNVSESCDVPTKLGDILVSLSALLHRLEWREQIPKYLLMLEPFCTEVRVKEIVATHIMEPLLSLLHKNAEHDADGVDFRIPREATARLIDLVRSSSKNKTLPRTWRTITAQLLQSNDMFHQLQCVELLFRITRQPKVVPPAEHPLLRSKDFTGVGGLPLELAEKIRDMPADSRMLQAAREVCQYIRLHQHTLRAQNRVQQAFRALHVTFAGCVVTNSPSEISFGPHFLVLMISPETAENVTVSYGDVASVRTGRDGSLTLRLLRTCDDLQVIPGVSESAGGQLVVTLSPTELQLFKDSPIISWLKLARDREALKHSAKREREDVIPSSGAGQLLEPVVLFPKEQAEQRHTSVVLRSVVEKQLRQFLDEQREERQTFVSNAIQDDLDSVQGQLTAARKAFAEKIADAAAAMRERGLAVAQQIEDAIPTLTKRVESDSVAIEPFKASLAESNDAVAFANSQLCDCIEQSRNSDKAFLKDVNSQFQRRIAFLHERLMMESLKNL